MKFNGVIISALILFILVVFAFSSVYASGIGTSNVTLTQYSVNVTSASPSNIGFTISLINGTPWGTSLSVNPVSSYISFSTSKSNSDPTYSGTLTVSAAANTPVGRYVFNVSAIGDDPSASPVQLVVNVLNSTNSSFINPGGPVLVSKSSNYFGYIGGIFVAVVAILLGLEFLMREKFVKTRKYVMLGSIVLSLASAAYLLAYDTLLRTSGMLHYDILIGFFILTIVLAYLIYMNKAMQKKAELILGMLSALFVLAMFLDAILGLPLTSVSGSLSYGFNYLFGFGSAGTHSLYGTSLAFSLLLLSTTATSILSLCSVFTRKAKK